MKLHDLRPAEGSRKKRRRVGRGIAAGQGKTAGRGTKGQKARAGGNIPARFEGGQTPLHVRIPKLRGFKNKFRIEFEVVNLGAIAQLVELGAFDTGDMPGTTKASKAKAAPITINQDLLRAVGLVRTLNKPMKVLGTGEIGVPLFVVADAFSKSAISKIEAAGGEVSILEIPTAPREALGVSKETGAAEASSEATAETTDQAADATDQAADTAAETSVKKARSKAKGATADVTAEGTTDEATAATQDTAPAKPAKPKATTKSKTKANRASATQTSDAADAPTAETTDEGPAASAAAEASDAAAEQPDATATAAAAADDDDDAPDAIDPTEAYPVVFESLLNAFRAPDIRRRILFVLGILIVYRLLAQVPLPGVDREALRAYFDDNAAFGLLDLFAGGGLSSLSVVGLAMNPYINASIIMQLMSGVVPRLQALSREGEYGRNKITQYTRYLTVPMAALQAFGILSAFSAQGIIVGGFDLSSFASWTQIVTLMAGAIALMWLGELITEKGIGNGISFIIFAGIVSQVPSAIGAFLANPNLRDILLFGVLAVAAVFVIIYIQEGQRRIPIQYASRVRGQKMYRGGQTFLPLRVNLAGVIPIIFAVSILQFPAQLSLYFRASPVEIVASVADAMGAFLASTTIQYAILYFLLVIGFTYFYTAFTFKPDETAEQLRKNGGFIPGIRPGRPTQDYLARVVFRITVGGALFLGTVAVAPIIIGLLDPSLGGIAVGGTGLLIIVSVVVETMKQIEAQLMMRNYEGFIR